MQTREKARVPVRDPKKMALRAAFLRTLYVGGALTLVMLAPKMSRIIGSPDKSKKYRDELYRRIRDTQYRLKHTGLVFEDDRGRLVLTKLGTQKIEKMLMKEYVIPPPALWDGKWRVLLFDIKEKRRRVRAQLRKLLDGAGFVRLQDSAWVHPYPCDEFVALVRAHLSSGVGELRHITADALESDKPLRNHFNLS